MKSFLKVFLIVAVGASLGIFAYLGYTTLPRELSWPVALALFFIVYMFGLSVHELGHFIAFYLQGIPCRGIFIFFLLFIKRNHRWRLEIRWNLITLFGGVVFPDYDNTIDENNFTEVRKAFARAVLWGPIASVLIAVLSALAFVFTSGLSNGIAQVLTYYSSVYLAFIAFFIVLLSMLENEAAIGDFPAYRYFRRDDFFSALQLKQSYIYASKPLKYRNQTEYLSVVLDHGIQERVERQDYSLFTYEAVHQRLMHYLSGDLNELPQSVEIVVKELYAHRMHFHSRLEIAKVLAFRIVPIVDELYGKMVAEDYYRAAIVRFVKRDKVLEYLRKQQAHYLKLEDHSEFLSNKDNITTTMLHPVLKFFEGYTLDDERFNRRIAHTP